MRQIKQNYPQVLKIKKAILTTLIIGFFFLVGGEAFANNLLTNNGFESGSVTGWTTAGPNWIVQNQVVYTGTYSAQNTIGTIPGQDYFASLSQTKILSAGTTIYATLRVKTDINPRSSAVAGVLIEFLRSNDSRISFSQQVIGGLTDWRQVYVSATAPSETAKVKFHAFVFATQAETAPGGIALNGKAYFDEAVLSTDYIAPPPNQTTLINSGFENGLNDWNLIYSPAFSVDNVVKFNGNYSIKNTIGTIPGQDFFSSASQDLQYLGGALYGSAYIKTNLNPSSTAVAGLLFEYYNQFNPSPGSRIGFDQQTLVGVNDWTRVLINGVTPPSGTVMVRVHVFTFANQGDSLAVGTAANFDEIVFSYSPLPPGDFRTTILNSGFENGLNDWSELYGFPGQVSSTAHSGIYSAKKTIGQIVGQDYYSQIYQDIYFNSSAAPFPTNTPVYATAYVKTTMNPVTKSKGGLQFEFIDASGNVIKDANNNPIIVNSFVGGNTDWRYLYITRQTPAGTSRVRVSGFEFARQQDSALAGNAFYDDFQFSLNPLPTPPAKIKLLNGNFENGLNDWDELNKPGEISTTTKHYGNYAAVFEVDNSISSGNYFGSASQDVKVYNSSIITVRVWVKQAINPLAYSAAGGLAIVFLDNNNQEIPGATVNSEVYNWQSLDWTALTVKASPPSNAKKFRFNVYLFADAIDGPAAVGSRVYFDDASFSIAGGGSKMPYKIPAD